MVQQKEICKWSWGSFEVRLGRRTLPGPGTRVDSIVANGHLEVCDGAYRIFVKKKSQRPAPSLRDRTGHSPSSNKTPRLTRRGSPGLEKRETLRQAQGRLWGTPGFSPWLRLRATRVIPTVIPTREKGPTRLRSGSFSVLSCQFSVNNWVALPADWDGVCQGCARSVPYVYQLVPVPPSPLVS
jgi:hypothetical protein